MVKYDIPSSSFESHESNSLVEAKDGFQCYDGTWLPSSRYCDGQRDCAGKNWEDEPLECCE